MSISLLDNIAIKKQSPNVERDLFDTIEAMVAYSENYLPAVFECNVKEDGKRYRYNVSNSVDPVLGKWREVAGGGDADLSVYYKKTEVDELLDTKVDKEEDMGLSHNDFTDTAKETLEALDTLVDRDTALTTIATTITSAVNELVTADADINDRIDDVEEEIEKLQKTPAIAVDAKPVYADGVITYTQDGEIKTTEDTDQWFYYSDGDTLFQTIWITGVEKTIKSGGVDFDEFVKKENIVDELTSTATDKPLSANQGKELSDALTQGLSEKLDIQQDEEKAGYAVKVGDDGKLILVEDGAEGDAADISYENETKPAWDNVKKALDGIIGKIYYVKPAITSFTVTPSTTTYEVGQKVDSLTFNWTVNKDITTQELTDCTVTVDDRTATYDTELSTSKTFTLKVGDGEENASSSIAINFRNKAYWGSAAAKDAYDSAFILGLSKSAFATAVKGTYDITVGAGQYGFLCVPSSFTKISSWYIGGFEVDLVDEGTISFTNASGGVGTYRIYRTTQPGLGSIKIDVK